MKYAKRVAVLLLGMFAAVLAVGCSDAEVGKKYNSQVSGKTPESGIVASNENYELKWDKEAQSVLLVSKETGKIWSDILYEAWLEGSSSANAKSALTITVVNTTNMTWETTSSMAELEQGSKLVCEELEDGLRVTYYFERFQIAVPVIYQLRENALAVSIDGADIEENGEQYQLVSVGIAPYFCSASNQEDGNYLFIPSGSGALMYTTENADGTRKYSGEVYGTDLTRKILKDVVTQEAIRLPVFGAKNGDTAVLGIIENGAGAAFIDAQAGYARLGYSQVGVTFYVRGWDTFRHGTYATGNAVITRVSEERSMQKMTVSYYPLQGEKADYNGMAACYRQYLQTNDRLIAYDADTSAYSVTFWGGTTIPCSFLGIPYSSLSALTGYEDARMILKELTSLTGETPITRMMYYGDNGLLPGTIAGGRTYDSVYGSKKQMAALQDYCREKDTLLFWDFDVVRYGKAGNGISNNADSAETAIHYRATQYPVFPTRAFDEEEPYRIISRLKLPEVMKKALKKAEKYGNTGLSFSSLGEYAFSDYSRSEYMVKGKMEKDVSELLADIRKNGKAVAVAGANGYAGCAADVIFDVTLETGDYNVLDEQIPFYQLVFHGCKPMYSPAINLSANAQEQIMLSAASGMGLGFTLMSDYDQESNELQFYKMYGAVYEDNKELIQQALENCGFAQYYTKTAGSIMTRYEMLDNGVSATYFENGTVLYANHTAATVDSPVGELAAYMFKEQ